MSRTRAVDEVAAVYRAHFEDREWEIYQEPFLNGIQPSLVVLHKRFGVCLLEVVEWNDDQSELRDEGGEMPVVRLYGKGTISTVHVPLRRLELIGREVSELYGFRLRHRMREAVAQITVGLVIPYLDLEISILNSRFLNKRRPFGLFAMDRHVLNGEDRRPLYPQLYNETFPELPDNAIADLRNWLAPRSDVVRTSPRLTGKQLEISRNSGRVQRRRILGGPGTGKTEAVVGRAATLSKNGKKVLFLTFNITLLNEIRERFAKYANPAGKNVVFLNIHQWAKRIGIEFGLEERMASMWAENADAAAIKIPALILQELETRIMPCDFDAVLVDEAQDMRGAWLRLALAALRRNGEFLIAADTGQDIYGAAEQWGPKDMTGLGFSGPWMTLAKPYRTPGSFTPFLNKFIREFPSRNLQDDNRPVALTDEHHQPRFNDKVLWYETNDDEIVMNSIELIHRLVEEDRAARRHAAKVSISDIAVLVDKRSVGIEIAEGLHKRRVTVATTFQCSWHKNTTERDLKLEFSARVGEVKISTIHSFKGLGTNRLVIAARQQTKASLIYTALSRVQSTSLGVSLYVLSANPKVNAFYTQYCKAEPHFPEIQAF